VTAAVVYSAAMASQTPPGSTTSYVIRPAAPADSETLVAFTLSEALDSERRTLNRGEVQRGVAGAFDTPPKARYWVVESGGQIVAAASIVTEWSNFRGGDYWWIQSLYIVPEHRGRGLVDTILQHLVAEAKAGRALDLRLYGYNTNARALRAYQRFGFREAPYLILTKSLIGE
jgi:ribosomal protein S18 acetylase RimI-like enzyme